MTPPKTRTTVSIDSAQVERKDGHGSHFANNVEPLIVGIDEYNRTILIKGRYAYDSDRRFIGIFTPKEAPVAKYTDVMRIEFPEDLVRSAGRLMVVDLPAEIQNSIATIKDGNDVRAEYIPDGDQPQVIETGKKITWPPRWSVEVPPKGTMGGSMAITDENGNKVHIPMKELNSLQNRLSQIRVSAEAPSRESLGFE